MFIESVGLGAWHAAVEDDAFAAARFGKIAGVIHEHGAIALAALALVDDQAGQVAGHTGEPKGVEVGAVAKARSEEHTSELQSRI